ncbi:MAG: STAS domain-containing protein [Acidobacteriota bacterium]
MKIEEKEESGIYNLKITGRIDISGAEKLKNVFNLILEKEQKKVVIDFGDVSFIGSSGIGKLLFFYKNLSSKNREIVLINLNSEIRSLFKAIKVDTLFNID